MPPPAASPVVALGIPGFALALAVAFVAGWARAGGRVLPAAAGVAAWLTLTAAIALSGFLARFDVRPPTVLPFMLLVVGAALGLGFSALGERLARALPLAWLVGIQGFRLPLELVLHRAGREGVMPVQMSFSGWNFDIVTGITALALAPLIASGRAPRALVVAWNALGLALLAAIGIIAVASVPALHAFGTAPERLNTWVAYFPYVWLPAGPVAFALAGHVIVARRLARTPRVCL